MQKPKVVAIVGPTASGKTALSIKLAEQLNGEVISADSRQVYRGMDIGTAKISKEEMKEVTHHLIDVVDPSYIYTATDFQRAASQAITDISARHKLPIIAGGTFFYIELLRGTMSAAPVEPDYEFRESLSRYSTEELLQTLASKDSRRAKTIDPHNRKRIVRALEIIETLGAVPPQTPNGSPYDWLIYAVQCDESTLKERYASRLTEWLDDGLLEEVTRIRATVPPGRFLEFGFEYTLTARYIDNEIDLPEYQERFVQKNWQYAKRQLTWLKKDSSIIWIDPYEYTSITQSVKAFLDT